MTLILEVPNDLERELEKAAARAGLPVAEYTLRVLKSSHQPGEAAVPSRTGAELLALWEREGLLGNGPDIEDPVTYARQLREKNQNRRHD